YTRRLSSFLFPSPSSICVAVELDGLNDPSSVSGKFMRRFRLPENAKMNQVKTSMENGVLTVTVPKAEVKKPDTVVSVSDSDAVGIIASMSNISNNVAGVDNTFRRKFDREEYLERARERERQEEEGRSKSKAKGPPVQRKPLKHRDYEVDLESRLGKTQVVTPVAPLSQQAGYYCSVCECVVKDSANYLDHINGKKHQRALGMSMRVERASLQQVQERFEVLKKRKDLGTFTEQDLDERVLKQQLEEEERKRLRREKKKEKKEKAMEEPEIDPDVAAMMGFGGFRSSKK
ncbi:hypothetical protein S245_005029, partial [Arachis hypogaea]